VASCGVSILINVSDGRAHIAADLAPRRSVRHATVLHLDHNFGVASQLDEVADRLAQQPLDLRHCCPGVLVRAQDRRGLLGTVAGVVGGVWMAMSALRRYPRLPDQLSIRRLYEQATGVDRDQANTDLALVADRSRRW
jgi:hypothetical protein